MQHAVEVAETGGAAYIRLFSFFIPEGTDPDSHRDEVLTRMSALAGAADDSDVILTHENEKDTCCDIPRRCLDIVTSVSSPNRSWLGIRPTPWPGRSPAVLRGVCHAASTCGDHPVTADALLSDRTVVLVLATARCLRRSEPFAQTASTCSSR